MKILELFSGTGSVGKEAFKLGIEVVSLDFKNATICTDIMDWDYENSEYQPGDFDFIWASPPCRCFSNIRNTLIGKKLKEHNGEIFTRELLEEDIETKGLPILHKAMEIIDYFNPEVYFIENPNSSKMKRYLDPILPFYVVDYCKYSNWGYQKRTRVWTDVKYFNPKTCKKDCENLMTTSKGTQRHLINMGFQEKTKANQIDAGIIPPSNKICGTTLADRYRIPPKLCEDLLKAGLTTINVKAGNIVNLSLETIIDNAGNEIPPDHDMVCELKKEGLI